MNDAPSVATELVRNVPLTAAAAYVSFISQYGAVIVTSLAIVYGVYQIILRTLEHKLIKDKHRIESDGSKRE